MNRMHGVALIVWSVFIMGVLYAEWSDPMMMNLTLWFGLIGYFTLFELVGGLRRHRGDMFSEYLWTFGSGKWGAQVFTCSFAVYFAERLYMLGAPAEWPTLPGWLPRATLLTGFVIWLVVHIWTRGRHG